MPGPLIMIPCLAAGFLLATWGKGESWWKFPGDWLLAFLGFFLGAVLAWSTSEPWIALGIVVLLPLILWRRRRPVRTR